MTKKAICLICLKPNKTWCKFLNNFTMYKIYMIIDYEYNIFDEFIMNYKNITFIQIDKKKCNSCGFKNLNFLMLRKNISGWDKATYYFTIINNSHDYIWFLEDDVFFYDESTIENIDLNFPNEDLLCNHLGVNSDGSKNVWWWEHINIYDYNPPYYSGMVCSMRLSKKIFEFIKEYADKYNSLFFLEAFFPTIAKKNNLNVSHPKELETILYREIYQKESINKLSLFHPVKKLEDHILFRHHLFTNKNHLSIE